MTFCFETWNKHFVYKVGIGLSFNLNISVMYVLMKTNTEINKNASPADWKIMAMPVLSSEYQVAKLICWIMQARFIQNVFAFVFLLTSPAALYVIMPYDIETFFFFRFWDLCQYIKKVKVEDFLLMWLHKLHILMDLCRFMIYYYCWMH